MLAFQFVLVALVAALLAAAAIIDGYSRIIPNRLNLAIAMLALPYWWSSGLSLWPDIALQIGIAAGMFILLLAVFQLGQMGGGDVKLLVALALFLHPMDYLWAVVGTALAGGIMTSAFIVYHRWKIPEKPFENPYGIAIAVGALLALGGRYGLVTLEPVLVVLFRAAIISCIATVVFLIALRIRQAR